MERWGTKKELISFLEMELKDDRHYFIKIDESTKKTKNQNAYYYHLEGEYAKWLRSKGIIITNSELHYKLITEYGTKVEGDLLAYLPLGADYKIYAEKGLYLKPTNNTAIFPDDTKRMEYIQYKGVRYLNSKELKQLIDGLKEEIEQQDDCNIQVMTEEELRQWDYYDEDKAAKSKDELKENILNDIREYEESKRKCH